MPATFLETRQVPLGDLQKFPGNARKGDLRRIRASIRRHGQYRSLVVRQGDDGQLVILAGNNTFDGLTAENYGTARCEIVTCTDGEASEINVKDNRLGDLATYDDKALLAQLTGLDDLDAAGYAADDVDELQRITGAFGDAASGFLNPFTDPDPFPPQWPQPGPGGPEPPGTVPPPPFPGNGPEPPPEDDPDGEGEPPDGPAASPAPGTGQPGPPPPPAQDFVQVAWVVTPGSRDTIRQAITLAQQRGDLGTSAEALHTIAAHYLNTCQ